MHPRDKELLIDASVRFVRWLRKNSPEVKDRVREKWLYDGFGERIRETPTAFWGDVGAQDYDVLTKKAESGESILDRVVATVKRAPPAVQNEIRFCRGAHVSATQLATCKGTERGTWPLPHRGRVLA